MTVHRCPAYGCRRRCRRDATRCTDHALPATPDLTAVAETTIRQVLAQVAHGTIAQDDAERQLTAALPLVQG